MSIASKFQFDQFIKLLHSCWAFAAGPTTPNDEKMTTCWFVFPPVDPTESKISADDFAKIKQAVMQQLQRKIQHPVAEPKNGQSDLLAGNPYFHTNWYGSGLQPCQNAKQGLPTPIHFKFEVPRNAKEVVAMLLPAHRRNEGFNQYTYFTNFHFAPTHPDYFSYRANSFHVKYFTHRHHHQLHPLLNIKRYVNSKTAVLHKHFVAMLAQHIGNDPDNLTLPDGTSKYETEVSRPSEDTTDNKDADGSDVSDGDDGTSGTEPPSTAIAVDGPKAGNWIAGIVSHAFNVDLTQQIDYQMKHQDSADK
jgi:hypothetical protein